MHAWRRWGALGVVGVVGLGCGASFESGGGTSAASGSGGATTASGGAGGATSSSGGHGGAGGSASGGHGGVGGTASPSGGAGGTTASGGAGVGGGTGGAGGATSSSGGHGGAGGGGGAPAACGDGVAVPGELCFLPDVLIPAADAYVVALGDVDGDQELDLVNTLYASGLLEVRLGQGNGTFGVAKWISAGKSASRVRLAPLGAGSLPDVVVSSFGDDRVEVFANDSTPGNVALVSKWSHTLGSPVQIAVGDFDGVGTLDLAVPDQEGNLLVALGAGAYGFATTELPAVGGSLSALVAADWNGDGALDLVGGRRGGASLELRAGDGKGHFPHAADVPAPSVGPSELVTADFDGDGVPDYASADWDAATVTIFHGKPKAPPEVAQAVTGLAPRCGGLVAVDLDVDGDVDLVAAANGSVAVVGDGLVAVLLNDGHGHFSVGPTFTGLDGANSVDAADLNGDSVPDLVFTQTAKGVHVLLSNP
jgi:hypothetical protein